jgi:hypothetical protein
MSDWINAPKEAPKDMRGFVYKITHLATGKYYIGQKSFWSKVTRPPLKGKTRKRRSVVESKWRSYWGSSKALLVDIDKYGQSAFKREIIAICDSKWMLSYTELKYQLEDDAILDPKCYNFMLNVRFPVRK